MQQGLQSLHFSSTNVWITCSLEVSLPEHAFFFFLHGGNKKYVQQFDKKIPWKARRVNSQKAQS